jgi:hypothetical protein
MRATQRMWLVLGTALLWAYLFIHLMDTALTHVSLTDNLHERWDVRRLPLILAFFF